jgi:hypothetical protein
MLMDSLADSGFGLLGRSNDPTIQKCIGSDLIFCYFWIKPKVRKSPRQRYANSIFKPSDSKS